MLYLLSSLMLILFHVCFYVSTKVNIYPELFVFPWLVSKGFLPYKDFFDHHGFLPYYILAPLTFDKTLFFSVLFYNLLQFANLLLVLKILKKITSQFWYFISGLLFVLLNYYFSSANFWFEHFFVFLSLLTYFLSLGTESFKGKTILLSFIIFLCSLIKPTYGLILIPYLLYHRQIKLLIYFLVFWISILVIFFAFQNLEIFIDSLFIFNSYAIGYIKDFYSFGISKKIFGSIIFITIISSFLYLRIKKNAGSFVLLVWIMCIYVLQGYTKINFLPFIPFFVFLIAYVGPHLEKNKSIIYKLLVILLCFFTFLEVKHQLVISQKNIPYIENPAMKSCVKEVTKKGIALQNSIYFDTPEYYYLLDQKPPTYYLLDLDFITKYRTDFEKRIIHELEQKKILHVVLRNQNKRDNKLMVLSHYLALNYKITENTKCFKYYERKLR